MTKEELVNQLDHLKDVLKYHDVAIKTYEKRIQEHKDQRKITFDKKEELRKEYESKN
jgi:hypothetical protein